MADALTSHDGAVSQAEITPEAVLHALTAYRFSGVNEYAVQDGIAAALTAAGIPFDREKVVGRDRFDFSIGSTVIEVKHRRAARADLIRQLGRYARHESVMHLIVATTSRATLASLPHNVHGVPVDGALLRGAFL